MFLQRSSILALVAFACASLLSTDGSSQQSGALPVSVSSSAPPAHNTGVGASNSAASDVFRIWDSSPRGMNRLIDSSRIYVSFTADVVSTETVNTTATATGVLTFDPSIEGYAKWTARNRVEFYPRKNLRPATRYVVRVAPALRDLRDRKLIGDIQYDFETEPLRLRKLEQVGFTKDRKVIVALEFSDEIAPATLEKYVSFRSGDKQLAWKAEKDVAATRLRLQTDPITTENLVLRIEAGLQGLSGPLGLTQPIEQRVPLSLRLLPDEISAGWRRDRAALRIHFTNGVEPTDLRKYIEVSPAVAFEVTSSYNEVTLTGDFQPETRYLVTVKAGLQGTNDELLLRDVTLSAWVPSMTAFVEMKDAGGHLSPNGQMRLQVRSASVKSFHITATRLYDNNLVQYIGNTGGRYNNMVEQLGRELNSKDVRVTSEPGKVATTNVSLKDLFGIDATGVYYVAVSADEPNDSDSSRNREFGDDDDDYSSRRYSRYYGYGSRMQDNAVLIVSNLGITGKKSADSATVWVTALDSAKPVQGAEVQILSDKNQLVGEGQTDANGLFQLDDIPPGGEHVPAFVIAKSGADVSYLKLGEGAPAESSSEQTADDNETARRDFIRKGYEAFTSTERGVYRPGETVHLFASIRDANGNAPAPFPMEVEIELPDGRTWEPRAVTATTSGTIVTEIPIPDYSLTGQYKATLRIRGASSGKKGDREGAEQSREIIGHTNFRVEDFLPNRLKVETTAPVERLGTSDTLEVLVTATEMFGQPAPGRAVGGYVTFKQAAFAPRQFAGFTFGDVEAEFRPIEQKLESITTDEDGLATVTIETPGNLPPLPIEANVQITTRDIGGRSITRQLERLFDPVPFYIGAKQRAETFAETGKPAEFEIVAALPTGTRVESAELTATVCRIEYNSILKRENGTYHYVTKRQLLPIRDYALQLRGGGTSVTWTPSEGGSYVLQVFSPDTGAVTALPFHVASSYWDEQPWSLEKPERLELVLDKKAYAPGERARLLVKAPFAGTLLLTLEQDRVLTASVVQMSQNTQEIDLPIDAASAPNVYCVVSVVHAVKPELKWLPHRASGMINVRILPESRRIALTIDNPAAVRPDTTFETTITAVDVATSKPTEAELVVWAVDEGVLSLTEFRTPDPVSFFNAIRQLAVDTSDFFSDLMPELAEQPGKKSNPGGGDEAGMTSRRRLSTVKNERVKPTVLWKGIVRTDAQGHATVRFDVPHFIGNLRIMTVAAAGPKFGSAESNIFVRTPLMIKDSLPRFLAPGDEAVAPFTIYNNTETSQPVEFAVSTSGPITLATGWNTDSTSATRDFIRTAAILPHSQLTVPVRFNVSNEAGAAAIRFEGTMAGEQYAETVNLPIRPVMPVVSFASYDAVPAGEARQYGVPALELLPGTTSGTLTISKSPGLKLSHALRYLYFYQYGCLEQTCSSGFPLIFMPDLSQFVGADSNNRYVAQSKVQYCVDRLLTMQTSSGGFSMWPFGREEWEWGSVYAAHFLVEAKKAGYDVPETNLDQAIAYVRARLSAQPDNHQVDTNTQRCYAAYVLAVSGKRNLERMETLYEQRNKLTPSGRALLASAFQLAGNAAEASTIMSEPATYNTTETVRDTGGILSSPARETALVLSAMLDTNANAAEIPTIVKRLDSMTAREGHWGTTQDNAFVTWALGKYARKMLSGKQTFTGSLVTTTASHDFSSSRSMQLSTRELGTSATVSVAGDGPAYLAWNIQGVPRNIDTTTVSKRLWIRRSYLDRELHPIDAQHLKQGELVIVDVEIALDSDVDNIVVEDLLPAGLEIENEHLATTERVNTSSTSPDDEDDSYSYGYGRYRHYGRPGSGLVVQRTDPRDDRMILFLDYHADYSRSRTRNYRYTARAITQGVFVLPPVHAWCMYDPEIEARSGAGTVQVFANR